MSDTRETLGACAETEAAVEPAVVPQPELAPEAAAADFDVGLDLSLAGAGFPAAGRTDPTPRLPSPLQARAIGRLQRQQGNFAVQRTLKRSPVQPLRGAQRKSAPDGDDDWLAERIEGASGGGQPLEPQAQARLEAALHSDLGDVRVHTDTEADAMANAVDAVAFTSGRDIFFEQGMYQPGTSQGLELLAHEAAHTVQQTSGPVAGTPAAGGISVSHPSDPFEQAAEKMAKGVTGAPAAAGRAQHAPETGVPGGQFLQREELPKPDEAALEKLAASARLSETGGPTKPDESSQAV